MAAARPFKDLAGLVQTADQHWNALAPVDWLEAFSHHPRIGDRQGSTWARDEQKSTATAEKSTLDELARLNEVYERKFGHVYLICATGKSAKEMLSTLEARLGNPPALELKIAAGEQAKITRIRLTKLMEP